MHLNLFHPRTQIIYLYLKRARKKSARNFILGAEFKTQWSAVGFVYSLIYLLFKMSIKPLSKETIKLINSTQVISSVYSAVKELVENSLDAQAKNIEVNLVSCVIGNCYK